MKKLFSLLMILSLVATYTFAQDGNEEGTTNGPKMQLETLEVDYGTIEQGSEPLREFHFANVGNEPLQITNAKGSCGCTVPNYPKEPIFPGEKGVIEVRYDTKRIGRFTKRVTLTTNEGTEKVVLTIKGEVKKKPEEPAGVPTTAPSILTAPNGN